MLELKKDMDIFEKIEIVEKQINRELPQIDLKKLPKIMGRVSHYIRGNIKKIDDDDRLIYDFLLRHKLNHRTLYQWFLLKNASYDLKRKVINKKIWLRHALKEMAYYTRIKENPDDNSIIKDIKRFVRGVVNG